jgi:hypothetical protein
VPVFYATGLAALLLWSVGHLFVSFGRNFGDGLWGTARDRGLWRAVPAGAAHRVRVLLVYFKAHETVTSTVSLYARVPTSLLDEVRDAIHDIAEADEPYDDETSEGIAAAEPGTPACGEPRPIRRSPSAKPDI